MYNYGITKVMISALLISHRLTYRQYIRHFKLALSQNAITLVQFSLNLRQKSSSRSIPYRIPDNPPRKISPANFIGGSNSFPR